jgi:Kef-type K+ transport system membrane component KefB
MKSAVVKWLVIISALLFADWLIMIFLGCFSGLCHASNRYFCSIYCYIGITLLSITALFAIYLAFRKFFQKNKNQQQTPVG